MEKKSKLKIKNVRNSEIIRKPGGACFSAGSRICCFNPGNGSPGPDYICTDNRGWY
jgi:hypothetical protein